MYSINVLLELHRQSASKNKVSAKQVMRHPKVHETQMYYAETNTVIVHSQNLVNDNVNKASSSFNKICRQHMFTLQFLNIADYQLYSHGLDNEVGYEKNV